MPRAFYLDIAEALRAFLPAQYRAFELRAGGSNLKVWFDEWHEHYEVQLIGRAALRSSGLNAMKQALEVGFHAEHPQPARNDEVLERIAGARSKLGKDAVAGPFLGRREMAERWRRLSELWDDPDLQQDGAAIEAAERLARYITTIEPARRDERRPPKRARARATPIRRRTNPDRRAR